MVEVLRGLADMEVAHVELTSALEGLRPGEVRGTPSQLAETPPCGLPVPVPVRLPVPAPPSPLSTRGMFHTPRTMTIANAESVPPIEGAPPSLPPPGGRSFPWVNVLTALGTFAVVFAVALSLGGPAPSEGNVAAGATAVAPPSPRLRPSPPAVVAEIAPPSGDAIAIARTAPALPPTTGRVLTPASARSHRVWIDGELAARASGVALSVACGAHVVRIGSAGASQSIQVPCGGDVSVDAK